MSINANQLRVGNFTSSNIYKLMTNGKKDGTLGAPALSYIQEKRFEMQLGRSINNDNDARATAWGNLLEARAFDLLGMEYTLASQETIAHPIIQHWTGSPDGWKSKDGHKYVIDIKCPATLNSFCQMVQPLYDGLTGTMLISELRESHKDMEKYYWQLISNAILTDCNKAELIVYMPYQSELELIRELAQNWPGERIHRFFWIANSQDEELPYILDEGYYKNINIIQFDIPQADKDALIERTKIAVQMLIG